jgi:hypothetical protein
MSSKNAIIQATRDLPAIAALAVLWQQLPEESADEYKAFMTWLDAGATRGPPPAKHAAIATRHEWAERAVAYERASDLARGEGAGGAGKITAEHEIVSNLTRMVQLETAKLLKLSASGQGPTVALKDLIATVGLIADLQKVHQAAASSKADFSKMTTEEIQQVLAAQKLLTQAQRK